MTDNIDRIQSKINSATLSLLDDTVKRVDSCELEIGVLRLACKDLCDILAYHVTKVAEISFRLQLCREALNHIAVSSQSIIELGEKHNELIYLLVARGFIKENWESEDVLLVPDSSFTNTKALLTQALSLIDENDKSWM
jgi:hypothetical protein